MAYNNDTAFKVPRRHSNPGGINIADMTNVINLKYEDSQFQILSNATGGALDLYLPSEKEDGAYFWVRSTGANQIHVRDASTTFQILSSNEACLIVCTGSTWSVVIKA